MDASKLSLDVKANELNSKNKEPLAHKAAFEYKDHVSQPGTNKGISQNKKNLRRSLFSEKRREDNRTSSYEDETKDCLSS